MPPCRRSFWQPQSNTQLLPTLWPLKAAAWTPPSKNINNHCQDHALHFQHQIPLLSAQSEWNPKCATFAFMRMHLPVGLNASPSASIALIKGVVIWRALFLSLMFTPKGNVLLTNNRGCDQKHRVYLSVPSSFAKAYISHQHSFRKAKTINLFLTCPAKSQGLAVFV